MNMTEEYYTYIYYDPSRNNEPIYIGKGKEVRAWSHMKGKKKHPFIQRLQFMKRENIDPVIGMYAGLDEEFAHLLEMELIAKFGRKDLGKGPLLNLTDGGEGNSGRIIIHSPETKEKMRLAKIGIPGHARSEQTRQKIRDFRLGRKVSLAVGERISQTKKGKPSKLKNRTRAILKCPHCGVLGGTGAMGRWHFSKCKDLVNI
jgi:hypothetical protein